jgi:fructose-1,6-bisphosphatase/inositol monophosphatase family enzyme
MNMFSRQDAERIGNIAASVAREEVMPRFAGPIGNSVRTKESAFDVVSDADEAAEHAISAALLELFPMATIIGEEATERDPGLLEEVAVADLAFLIDPIDGTKNFVSGLPLFGTMIAALVRGEIVFGAIHDPVRRDTAFALAGGGAWLQGDNQPAIALRVWPTLFLPARWKR